MTNNEIPNRTGIRLLEFWILSLFDVWTFIVGDSISLQDNQVIVAFAALEDQDLTVEEIGRGNGGIVLVLQRRLLAVDTEPLLRELPAGIGFRRARCGLQQQIDQG